MPTVQLEDRALITLAGLDAEHFLQNIITTDLDALKAGEAKPGALLSPQGKILFDFLVFRDGDQRLALDCRCDVIPDFARRLMLYRLRAKVEISADDDRKVSVRWADSGASSNIESGNSSPDSNTMADTRFPKELDVARFYGPAVSGTADRTAWDKLRIEHGIAESGSDYELGDAFPHDVLLDQMNGVGFGKGCYIGQEVVSRMQHRGTARRRVLIATGAGPLPAAGAELMADGRSVGTLGTTVGSRGLAIARIDKVKAAMDSGQPIVGGAVPVGLAIPDWAKFTFPQDRAEGV
ncbi:MAG: folate-binding protein YgfZ [Rhizobiaceae bacterium]